MHSLSEIYRVVFLFILNSNPPSKKCLNDHKAKYLCLLSYNCDRKSHLYNRTYAIYLAWRIHRGCIDILKIKREREYMAFMSLAKWPPEPPDMQNGHQASERQNDSLGNVRNDRGGDGFAVCQVILRIRWLQRLFRGAHGDNEPPPSSNIHLFM